MQAAFAGRSDYFRALFQDHFGETSHENKGNENADDEHSVDVLILRDVTAEVFAQVVLYVYSNYAKVPLVMMKLYNTETKLTYLAQRGNRIRFAKRWRTLPHAWIKEDLRKFSNQ